MGEVGGDSSLLICCSLCRLFPESLRWLLATQHYRRSKAMMLRIARTNQVDMTTDSSGVLAGEDDGKHLPGSLTLFYPGLGDEPPPPTPPLPPPV